VSATDSLIPAALVAATEADVQRCHAFLAGLAREHVVFCGKVYRIDAAPFALPLIPCLDHEAMLQGSAAPHLSVYVEDPEHDLHEVTLYPSDQRVWVDVGATLAETSVGARQRLLTRLKAAFPEWTVDEMGPSLLRGDVRVAQVVRSQLRLREVLAGDDTTELRWKLEKLRAIADLMEKESRVGSWAVRTLTPIVLAAAGVGSWWVLGWFEAWLSERAIESLRYLALSAIGFAFLVVGLKAVHLTEMGTRVWKRATEYKLILDARARHAKRSA